MNTTVQNHLDARRLEAHAADDQEVLGFWKKALVARADAANRTSSPDNRLLRAYDAARLAALAVVHASGYRTRGGDSHHYVSFDVARSLAGDPDLRRAFDTMSSLRKVRQAVEYEADSEVDENTVSRTLHTAEQVIALGHVHLEAVRPTLRGKLGG